MQTATDITDFAPADSGLPPPTQLCAWLGDRLGRRVRLGEVVVSSADALRVDLATLAFVSRVFRDGAAAFLATHGGDLRLMVSANLAPGVALVDVSRPRESRFYAARMCGSRRGERARRRAVRLSDGAVLNPKSRRNAA